MKPITIERIIKTKFKLYPSGEKFDEIVNWYMKLTNSSLKEAKTYIIDLANYYKLDYIDLRPNMHDSEEQYSKKQAIWVKRNNIMAGDQVVIICDCRQMGTGWAGGERALHGNRIGEIVTIHSIGNNYININGNGWPYWAFEKVKS